MRTHRFDPLSFFFGLMFTALAVWILFSDDLDIFSARWVWPAILIVGGLAMLGSMFGRRTTSSVPPEPDAAELDTSETAELLADAAAELPDEPHFR